MLSNRTTQWSLGAGLLCIVILAASWFMLISPRRATAADVHDQAVSADSQAILLDAKIAQLKTQFAGLAKQQASLKTIKAQLPPGADIPAFVRVLQSISAQSGAALSSITPGAPIVLSATGGSASTSTTAPAGSVVSIPMSISVTGQYFEASLFLKYLETKVQRSYLATGLNLTPETSTPTTTATPTGTATAVPTVTATAGSTAGSTATATASASADTSATLDNVTMSITGSVFVLLDGTSTFDDVSKDARAAATAATATPAVSATAS
jgi:Tfp pilus assembly protein PilO